MKERILELRAQGLTYAQIAAEVGLSKSRVGQIITAHEWWQRSGMKKAAPEPAP